MRKKIEIRAEGAHPLCFEKGACATGNVMGLSVGAKGWINDDHFSYGVIPIEDARALYKFLGEALDDFDASLADLEKLVAEGKLD